MNALGYEEYERLSEGGRPVPVFRELPGDLRTPVSAFLSLAARAQRAFLLESVLGGERLAPVVEAPGGQGQHDGQQHVVVGGRSQVD